MREGRLVLARLSDHLPWSEFTRCVQRYRPRYPSKSLSHWLQLLPDPRWLRPMKFVAEP
ncbi:DUF4372 domain-containing protein [Ottowia sp.]|uniref:DUF4372 domain-containing protein n=1 Tax=Ottowia sp. TaxID=1898956 RepID=UPI0039E6BAC1